MWSVVAQLLLPDSPLAESLCCVLSKTLYLLLCTSLTQEDKKSSRHDWKIVDWDVKQQNNKEWMEKYNVKDDNHRISKVRLPNIMQAVSEQDSAVFHSNIWWNLLSFLTLGSSLTRVTAFCPWASLVLVQPRKTRPFITERLLMGRKESNQTEKNPFQIIEFSYKLYTIKGGRSIVYISGVTGYNFQKLLLCFLWS